MQQTQTHAKERTQSSQLDLYEFERIYHLVAERYGHPSKDALDYGCGSGYGTALLAKSFGRVVGIDVDEESITLCREQYPSPNLSFEAFESGRQPFANETFDFIGAFQVFEHIPLAETQGLVRALWLMLRPGGISVITTP